MVVSKKKLSEVKEEDTEGFKLSLASSRLLDSSNYLDPYFYTSIVEYSMYLIEL